jgi:hypothetical protein
VDQRRNNVIGALTEKTYVVWAKNYQSAATSAVTSDAVNLAPGNGQAYSGVRFIVKFGTAATDNTAKLQQSSDDAATDAYSDLEGTSISSGASDEIVILDCPNPQKQYLKCVLARGTSSTVESIVAELYNPRTVPVDNTVSGTVNAEINPAPEEGTA